MKPELKIANVDGKKALVVNGRSLLNKQQVTEQIAALNERMTKQLPAAKAKLRPIAPKYSPMTVMSIRNWSAAIRRLIKVATAHRNQNTVAALRMPRILAMMNTGRRTGFDSSSRAVPLSISREMA